MMIDAHCHIFNTRIVENMRSRPALVEELHLGVRDVEPRLEPAALQESAERNDIELCLLLPSTGPGKVRAENDRFIGFTRELPRLRTLATLHPAMKDLGGEISRMTDLGIPGFKFSSFSQRFDPASPESETMLAELERRPQRGNRSPVVVFDTFVKADDYLAADPAHLTTPSKLSMLARRHPGSISSQRTWEACWVISTSFGET